MDDKKKSAPQNLESARAFKEARVPTPIIVGVVLICVAPFILNLFGITFESRSTSGSLHLISDLSPHEVTDFMFRGLTGALHHTLLEWSAFLAAIFTVILAFTHYSAQREITTPIIGVVLFCAGCMDAFHTLAADQLIPTVAESRNLILFTWAICRLFNAVILIAGVSMFLSGRKILAQEGESGGLAFVLIASAAFGMIGYLIIHVCATSEILPETQFPNAWVTRPWDVAPLVLYLFAGFILLPRFYKKHPSIFSHALILSMVPQVATQIHAAFGSYELFDNDFNIAHFLKINAYLVPMIGLVLDYSRTYKEAGKRAEELEKTVHELERSKTAVEESKARVEQVLKETEEGRSDFKKANRELRRINRAAVRREERMVELKKTINKLSKELKLSIPFASLDEEDEAA
jgi:two-component system, NtrC family, sensor kinase